MSRLFKRWWMLVAVLVTASVVVVSGTIPAFAAEPGEDSSWTNERVNNGGTLQSLDTYSEARGDNGLVQIWRGLEDHVWLAVNNGPVFAVGGGGNGTRTLVAPRVVWMDGWFYAFHTGTDNRIYWSRAFDGTIGAGSPSFSLGINWSAWTAIAGNPATTQSVSVATTENGLLMTWIGVNQTTMYSAWLNAGSDVFNATQVITNANSNNAPVVTFNPRFNEFLLVFRGLFDNQVYEMGQILGESTWSDPQALSGITTSTSPVIASDAVGNVLIAAINSIDGTIMFRAYNTVPQTHGWSQESTREPSTVPVWISVVGAVFYLILTHANQNDIVQYKAAWNTDDGF